MQLREWLILIRSIGLYLLSGIKVFALLLVSCMLDQIKTVSFQAKFGPNFAAPLP